MISPSGKDIVVGFAEHEDLWILAALELGRTERLDAFQQIADMAGRRYASISNRAKFLAHRERVKAREFLEVTMRKTWHAQSGYDGARRLYVPYVPPVLAKPALPASGLRKPSNRELMAGRAPTRRAREIEAAE